MSPRPASTCGSGDSTKDSARRRSQYQVACRPGRRGHAQSGPVCWAGRPRAGTPCASCSSDRLCGKSSPPGLGDLVPPSPETPSARHVLKASSGSGSCPGVDHSIYGMVPVLIPPRSLSMSRSSQRLSHQRYIDRHDLIISGRCIAGLVTISRSGGRRVARSRQRLRNGQRPSRRARWRRAAGPSFELPPPGRASPQGGVPGGGSSCGSPVVTDIQVLPPPTDAVTRHTWVSGTHICAGVRRRHLRMTRLRPLPRSPSPYLDLLEPDAGRPESWRRPEEFPDLPHPRRETGVGRRAAALRLQRTGGQGGAGRRTGPARTLQRHGRIRSWDRYIK